MCHQIHITTCSYKELKTMSYTPGEWDEDYSDEVDTGEIRDGHHDLLTAILHRSIIDYLDDQKCDQKPSHRLDAHRFFFPPEDTDIPFSFHWIASHLAGENVEGFKETIRKNLLSAKTVTELKAEHPGRFDPRLQRGRLLL
jgi:hypothetical protein